MRYEYVVWGIPKGKIEEQVLYTKATTQYIAEAAKSIVERKYGATAVRIQTVDMSKDDIGKMFKKAVTI